MLRKSLYFSISYHLILLMSFPFKLRSFMTSAFVQAPSFTTGRLSTCGHSKVNILNQLGDSKYTLTSSSFSTTASYFLTKRKKNFQRYDSLSAMNRNRSSKDEGMSNRMDQQRMRRNESRREKFPSSSKPQQNFLENFRGTRVFVQGIPDHVSWQDLKDHFKVAGEVVFASVSIDPSTGVSKGCGIVQFETTEMASNAIQIMRDHPMDGSVLYVREDYQENKEGQELGQQALSGSNVLPTRWKCADETNLSFLSKDDLLLVRNLIKARDEARRRKNYDTSDIIREDLKKRFSVHIDDRLKLWWVSADNSVPNFVSETKGDGRWGKLKPWRQIPTTIENDSCVNPDLVNGLLSQRDIARREKDFSTADRLLEEARVSPDGELTLRIHDESRTWRVWTNEPPPRPASVGQNRMGPAEQCIMIVEKYDPSKVQEVRNLLERFPGREYNILKKLKQNYNV